MGRSVHNPDVRCTYLLLDFRDLQDPRQWIRWGDLRLPLRLSGGHPIIAAAHVALRNSSPDTLAKKLGIN